jgi:hypothetical protein
MQHQLTPPFLAPHITIKASMFDYREEVEKKLPKGKIQVCSQPAWMKCSF